MPYVPCRAVQGRAVQGRAALSALKRGTVGTERLHWCQNSPRLRVALNVQSTRSSIANSRCGLECRLRAKGRGVAAQMNTPCRYDERMSLKEDYDYTAAVACRAHCTSAHCAAHRLQLLRRTGRSRTYVRTGQCLRTVLIAPSLFAEKFHAPTELWHCTVCANLLSCAKHAVLSVSAEADRTAH
jgi:hypothetical protein